VVGKLTFKFLFNKLIKDNMPSKKSQSVNKIIEAAMKEAPIVRDPNFSDSVGRVCYSGLMPERPIVYH